MGVRQEGMEKDGTEEEAPGLLLKDSYFYLSLALLSLTSDSDSDKNASLDL